MEKICQFLGKKLEPEELNSVLKNSSFQAMKENNMSNYSLLKGQYFEENGQLLRKGKENILVPEVPVVSREHLPQVEKILEVLPSRRTEANYC